MVYEEIKLAAHELSPREKLKLAQYLIQSVMKHEESVRPTAWNDSSPKRTKVKGPVSSRDMDALDLVGYVKERLVKSRPSRKQALINYIAAMFQFQGGIGDDQINEVIVKLEREGDLVISGTKVLYPKE